MTRRTRPMRHARTPVSTGPSRRLTRRGVTVGAVIGLTLSALPAWAYWTSSASTSASATATTLQPPAIVTPTPTGMTTTQITVTAGPAAAPTPTGYRITRGGSPVCGNVSLNVPCSDSGLTPGTTYTYTVQSLLRTKWVSPTVSVQVTTDPVPAPSKPSLASGSRSGVLGETYTTSSSPTYGGTALVGSTVTLYVDGAAVGTSAPVPAGGTWTVNAGTPTPNRQHTVTARANFQGGTSAPSTAQLLVIDSQRPTSGAATSTCAVTALNGFCPGQVRVSVTGTTDPSNLDGTPTTGPSYLDYTVSGGSITSTAAGALSFLVNAPEGSTGSSFTARVRDEAGNGAQTTLTGTTASVTVDRTAPAVTGAAYTSSGSNSRRMDQGDTISLVFSDTTSGLNPRSICSAWQVNSSSTQTATGLTARISAADVVTIPVPGSCGTVNLGSIGLDTDWVSSQVDYATSSMSWNPSTSTLTITLGGSFVSNSNNGFGNATFTPSTAITDRAGNPISSTTFVSSANSRF